MPHLFFFSYARANTKRIADSDLVRTFREALEGEVEQLLGNTADEICFFDGSDIEAGAEWRSFAVNAQACRSSWSPLGNCLN